MPSTVASLGSRSRLRASSPSARPRHRSTNFESSGMMRRHYRRIVVPTRPTRASSQVVGSASRREMRVPNVRVTGEYLRSRRTRAGCRPNASIVSEGRRRVSAPFTWPDSKGTDGREREGNHRTASKSPKPEVEWGPSGRDCRSTGHDRVTEGRSGPRSSPWSTPPRSRPRTSLGHRRRHRLRQGPAVRSSNRR